MPNSRKVFTNGCFDLLHEGHLDLLKFAKSKGDTLIVGLNSDSSVKRLKGPERPIHSEDFRKTAGVYYLCRPSNNFPRR